MEENQETEKKRMMFVIKVGVQMRNFLNDCLVKNFETHQERSDAFYSVMINFVCNTISEVSEPDKVADNLQEVIEGLNNWLNGKENVMIKYNFNTEEYKKQGLH